MSEVWVKPSINSSSLNDLRRDVNFFISKLSSKLICEYFPECISARVARKLSLERTA